MMGRIFLGKPLHWLVTAVFVVIAVWMGTGKLHTRQFDLYLLILGLVTAAAVGLVIATSRAGERITREPFEQDPREG